MLLSECELSVVAFHSHYGRWGKVAGQGKYCRHIRGREQGASNSGRWAGGRRRFCYLLMILLLGQAGVRAGEGVRAASGAALGGGPALDLVLKAQWASFWTSSRFSQLPPDSDSQQCIRSSPVAQKVGMEKSA